MISRKVIYQLTKSTDIGSTVFHQGIITKEIQCQPMNIYMNAAITFPHPLATAPSFV